MPAPDTSHQPEEPSRWPYANLFLFGTFGARSAEGRRFHVRAYAALGVVALYGFLLSPLSPFAHHLPLRSPWNFASALVPGLSFAYICLEYRRYLAGLEELARRIQYEAITFSYCLMIVLGLLIGCIGLSAHWQINPAWVILAEPIRGLGLVLAARRYR